MKEGISTNRWTGFFENAKVWKAILVVAVYVAIFTAIGPIVATVLRLNISGADLMKTPENIYIGFMLPVAIAGILFATFLASIKWLRPIFGKQPIKGSRWMWIAPILVVLYIISHFASADYAATPLANIIALIVATAFVGFAEELVTRGFVVRMVRKAGKQEWVVMLTSAVLFGLMHAVNLISGQELTNTLVQLAITMSFGVVMYLTLRVTGSIVFPIVLHGLYDASLFTQTGAVTSSTVAATGPFASMATYVTAALILFGFIAMFLVRGKVASKSSEPQISAAE